MLISAKEIANRWQLTQRRIAQLCLAGEIEGAVKKGRFWMIPEDAPVPEKVKNKPIRTARPGTTRLLPCPVGVTSYKEAVTEYYYVDKTLFIKDILDDHSKAYLFTRPRRFGKTLMMDMVKTFFENMAEDTSVYFRDKLIWKQEDVYRQYQGKYPVIYLSFKDAHYEKWEDMYQALRYAVKKEFRRHRELLDSGVLSETEKKYFSSVLNTQVSEVDCQNALGELSYMLSLHYGRKVIIIIDEYDTPIQQGHLNGYYDQVTGFMRNLFSAALKDNENLEFGILTGILRVAKESLFSGLNNLVVNTTLDEKYASYFGFTEEEVAAIANYYGKADTVVEIRKWYDGYLFGDQKIYNPWSVLNYFSNDCKAKAFWSRTSSNDVVGKLIRAGDRELYTALEALVKGDEIQAVVDTDIIYPEIDGAPDAIYSFLLMAGYLKVTGVISEIHDNPICSLKIPNLEIRGVFQKEILENWNSLFTGTVLKNFEMALRTGDEKRFQNTLSDFLLHSASSFDTAQETFYHGMVLGMLSLFTDSYIITSNRESGEGRFDIQMEPRDKKNPGYLLEFKADKNLDAEQMEGKAEEALQQIRSKSYAADLQYRGIKKIICYGVAFSGKKASVKCERADV